MITSLREDNKINKIRSLLANSSNIVAVTHSGPDGDAIGSTTAFKAVMQRLEKTVNIITPDMMLASLRSVPFAKDVCDATKYPDFAKKLISEADLIVCLDFNALSRLGKIGNLIKESSAAKILIDHHTDPENFADVAISRPEVSSTCFLLFRVLCALELFAYIDKDSATSILTGMMTDTGNFSYNCDDPDIYVVIAELIKKGVDKEKIYKQQFATRSLDSLKIQAYAIDKRMEVNIQEKYAIISLSRAELNQFNYVKGDTEGLVNKPLEVPGIELSVFLREEDGFVKVSMRSTDSMPFANKICTELFGGGGHAKAAGGEFDGTLSECIEHFKNNIQRLENEFSKD